MQNSGDATERSHDRARHDHVMTAHGMSVHNNYEAMYYAMHQKRPQLGRTIKTWRRWNKGFKDVLPNWWIADLTGTLGQHGHGRISK
jgi:hypothetical protein